MTEMTNKKANLLRKNTVWVLLVLLVVGIAVALTLVIEQAEDSMGWTVDLTANQVYTIGQTTTELLGGLEEDVNIYTVYPAGEEDANINELLRRYGNASDKVHIDNIDPIREPFLMQKFEEDDVALEDGTIIVASASNESEYRVILPETLYEWKIDGEVLYATGLVAEQRVTSAIESLLGGEQTTVYFVEGHGEVSMDDLYYISGTLENDNYSVASYNLLYNDKDLEPYDCLLFVAPMQDLSDEEVPIVTEFLESGGSAIFLVNALAPELPNFEKVLETVGMHMNNDLVIEADTAYYYSSPLMLVPDRIDHPAVQMLTEADATVAMSRARSVTVEDANGYEGQALFMTSDQSYGKTNPETTTAEREEGDTSGPFAIAAATENAETGSRVVLFGSSDFISTLDGAQYAGNLTAFIGSLAWGSGNEGRTVAISPKSLVSPALQVDSQTQSVALIIFVLIVIPVIIAAIGILVWRKRVAR